MNSFFILLRALFKDDLRDRQRRMEYVNHFVGRLPGNFGITLRQMIIPRFFKSCGKTIKIHPGIRYRGAHNIVCGENARLGVDNFYNAGGGLTLGNNVILGPGVKIWTANHRHDSVEMPISRQGMVYRSVTIGDDVWLGSNVFILPGVELSKGCIVSAGSVVNAKKYPPYSILAGNPARIVGYRKKENTQKQESNKSNSANNPA